MRGFAFAIATVALGWSSLAGAQDMTPEARSDFERACEAGDARSCREAARGWLTIDRNRALALLERGCAGGDARSCGGLGLMLVSDDEAGRDYARAAPLLEQACADEFGAACGSLATMVYLGTGVPAADPQRAMGLAERGCSLRDAQSCAMVGLLLSTGQVSSIDLGRAATALNFACAEGALNACELLENAAALVMQRIDPRVERERALPMFDMACQHGQPRACGMVGAILDEGLMGPADPERGVAAFQRGCTLNHAMSCARLAEAYRVGRGIARDAAQARASAERAIAIDPDNRDAARVLRRLR